MEQTEFISDRNISQKKRGLCFVQSPLCVVINLSFSIHAIFSWASGFCCSRRSSRRLRFCSSLEASSGCSSRIFSRIRLRRFSISSRICPCSLCSSSGSHRYAAQFGAGSHLRPEHQRHASFRNAPGDLRRITSQRQASDGDAG